MSRVGLPMHVSAPTSEDIAQAAHSPAVSDGTWAHEAPKPIAVPITNRCYDGIWTKNTSAKPWSAVRASLVHVLLGVWGWADAVAISSIPGPVDIAPLVGTDR